MQDCNHLRTSETIEDFFNIIPAYCSIVVEIIYPEGICGLQVPWGSLTKYREHIQKIFKVESLTICGEHLTHTLSEGVLFQLWHVLHLSETETSGDISSLWADFVRSESTEAFVKSSNLFLGEKSALLVLLEVLLFEHTLPLAHGSLSLPTPPNIPLLRYRKGISEIIV